MLISALMGLTEQVAQLVAAFPVPPTPYLGLLIPQSLKRFNSGVCGVMSCAGCSWRGQGAQGARAPRDRQQTG